MTGFIIEYSQCFAAFFSIQGEMDKGGQRCHCGLDRVRTAA
jgi:hypothetical protein